MLTGKANKIKISFVVPVYNVEQYLPRCIDSVIASGLQEEHYEIILVNDGSTDNSTVVAQNYCNTYSNISMVSQKNQGPSTARNTGMKYATGHYVWFIDSDDYLDSTKIQEVYQKLIDNSQLDILGTCCNVIDGESHHISDYYPMFVSKIMQGRNAVLNGFKPCAIWGTLYRLDFLRKHKLTFTTGIISEDAELSLKAMALAKRVMFTNIVTYNYIRRAGSISDTVSSEKAYLNYHSNIVVALSFANFSRNLNDNVLADNILRRSNSLLAGMLMEIKRSKNPNIDRTFKEKILDEIADNGCYPVKGPFLSWKTALFCKMLNIKRYILI